MPLKANLKKKTEQEKEQSYTKPKNNVSLPKKTVTTAKQSAQAIKKSVSGNSSKKTTPRVQEKRSVQTNTSKQKKVYNRNEYKWTASDKKSYRVGDSDVTKGHGNGTLQYPTNLREIVGQPTNPDADAMKSVREARKTGTQTIKQGGHQSQQNLAKSNKSLRNNERHQAYSDPTTRAVAQEVFATNPAAKFLGNMSESFLNYSPIGMGYSLVSGESMGTELANENPELYSRLNEGVSARLGDFAGVALGTKFLDIPFENWATGKAKAVLDGTKVGQKIKNGAVNGKIGQYIGKEAMNNRLEQYLSNQILNTTVEATQNALGAYGEGYRGKDLMGQTLAQTAFDVGLNSAFSGIGLGINAGKVWKGAKSIGKESVDSIIKASNTKSEYLNNLMSRLRAFNDAKYNATGSRKIGDVSAEKAKEFSDEYRKVIRMTDEEFANYKNGGSTSKVNTETNANNKTEPKKNNVKSKATGKEARSPKANKTTYKPAESKPNTDYSSSYGEPEKGTYRINPKEYDYGEETVKHEGQSRISIKDLENRAKADNGRVASEEKPTLETANEKRNRVVHSDGIKRRASVNDFKDRLANKDEITRFESINREVRERFPKATAEEREALESALRHNDDEAFAKAQLDMNARLDAEKIEAQRLEYKPQKYEPPKTEELKVAEETPEIKTEAKIEEPAPAKETESKTEEPQEIKEEAPKGKEKKAPSANIQDAIDGKTDWHDLKVNEKAEYIRRQGGKVGRNDKTHAKLNKIGEDLEKAKNAPKAEEVKSVKEIPKLPSELPSEKIENIRKLEAGTFVVHKNFGIGKFTGIEKLDGTRMARVQFADSPSGNMSATYIALDKIDDYLKKYAGDDTPKLDQMTSKVGKAHFDDSAESSATKMTADEKRELLRSRRMGDNGKMETESEKAKVNEEDDILETETSGVDVPLNGGKDTTINITDNGTYTISNTSPKELPHKPKRLTRENGLDALKRNEKKKGGLGNKNDTKSTEQPKKEPPKTSKPLSSESTSDDVVNRFGESKKGRIVTELDETLSKYTDGETTKSFETFMRSPEISDEAKQIMKEMRDNNEAFIKQTITNKQVLAEAEKKVATDLDKTYNTFMSNAESGRQATSQDQADALHLVRELINRGEMGKAAKVNAELSAMATENARFLQAQRIWNALTPEGRVRSTLSAIRRLEKSRGMASGSIEIGDEGEKLLKAIYNAETNAEIARANKEFSKYIWNQIPATFAEKCNAWRYLAMLCNPKTHIRNVLGNAAFLPARIMSDSFSAVGEKIFAKRIAKLGGDIQGTHAILNRFSKDDRALLKKAGESFKDDRALMESMSSKFFEKQRPIESPTFSGKPLQFLERLNSYGLEKEDEIFMGITYRSAYAQFCKANGIKASDITPEMAKRISDYAQEEALKATYRDANALADAFNKLRKSLNVKKGDSTGMKVGKKAAGFLLDSTIPFVKTPMNILKRGAIEYTPIRAFHGMAKIVSAKDADSLLKGIEYLSTGLTGSAVLGAGALMAIRGYLDINGSMGEYDKKVAYDQMLGEQGYSITIPFSNEDISINLDWVAPMSMPFFVGVEFGKMVNTGKNGIDDMGTYAIEALSNIADPIFEMSMLQGVENVFNTAFSDGKGLSTIAKNAGANYISQYVPTLFGQASRTLADNKKTVVSTSDNPLVKEFQKQFGKILNKTPIGNAVNEDYVDQWGRVQPNENKARSALENFLSPAYLKTKNETTVDTELKRLYDALGEEDKDKIIPNISSTAYKQKFDDKEFVMTPSEFTQYKKTVGQAKFNGLKDLFSTSEYKNASDDEKRKMIESVYDEAVKVGKREFLMKADSEFASAPDFYMLDKTQRDKYSDTISMSKQEWATTLIKYKEATEKNADGTGGLTADEKRMFLLENGVKTYEEAQSFLGESTSENKWNEAVELKKSGKTLASIQKEAEEKEERQKNMTESEIKFDNYSRSRAETRYADTSRKVIDQKLYDAGIYELQYVDKHTDNNGSITQDEAQNAIENLDQMYGLTQEQKAYFWYLFQTEKGWKKQPYGAWNG